MKNLHFLFLILVTFTNYGQIKLDSSKINQLNEITVHGMEIHNRIDRLQPVSGTYLFSGKKTEVVSLKSLDGNITDKIGRQIFAKVPGVFVYDMDGAGNQMNISTRGLDPHRGWEFNIRTNGILTNSDMYAYPASHYSIPLESVERIELVRGTGSLQYGAQFGGMLNYVTKKANTEKKLSLESYHTVGSFNLLSTYSAISGKLGKFTYYAYATQKSRDGYRQNEHTNYNAQSIQLTYAFRPTISIKAEWARSFYLYRLPGPLTDSMFHSDPTQATRSRNYFNPAIQIPSIHFYWKLNDLLTIEWISSAVIGKRNSILFDKPATVLDTIHLLTKEYSNRQIDIDLFRSFTHEFRLLQKYKLGKHTSHISFGAQGMHNQLHRRQQGKGTTGSDFDLTLSSPDWGRDIYLKSKNLSIYLENSLQVSSKFSLNSGVRFENGFSQLRGKMVYYPIDKLPFKLERNYLLFGSSFSYKINDGYEFYGGISQTYRPMIFKDLVPTDAYERVDPNLSDAKGYNAELGTRGNYKELTWDLTAFALQYNNRFGTLLQSDGDGNMNTYRTNIGNSHTKGIEAFVQVNWHILKQARITVFTSTTIMDGKYTNGIIKSGNENISIAGNRIESVPQIISRNSIAIQHKKVGFSALYSFTSKTFADALNTVIPTANGAVGLVPSYGLLDFNSSLKISNHVTFKSSLNNVANKQYFTKRPLFYPGVGIWPSDGRNYSISCIIQI